MNPIKPFLHRFPMMAVIAIILICLGLFSLEPYSELSGTIEKDMLHSSVQTILTIGLIIALIKLDLLRKSGLITPFKNWHRLWWVAALPMALIGVINALSIEWESLAFSLPKLLGWIFNSFSTGIFEETLLRGFCFCLFLTAWQDKPHVIYKAAFAQAVLFGLAHLFNLQDGLGADVYPQVIYATLLGIGFAGIVAFTKSIWPAIGIHTVINALSDVNTYFAVDYVRTPPGGSDYIGAIIVIFAVSTLPGLLMLRQATKQAQQNRP